MNAKAMNRWLPFFMAFLLCVNMLTACSANGETDPYRTVGEIAGRPVALGELQLFVDDVRQQTNSYFKRTYQLDSITDAEWKQDFGGESPVDYAIQLAMEELPRLGDVVEDMVARPEAWRNRIEEVRSRMIYHKGRGGEIAGAYLLDRMLAKQGDRAVEASGASRLDRAGVAGWIDEEVRHAG